MNQLAALIVSIVLIIVSTTRWKWHPFLSLLFVSFFYGIMAGVAPDLLVETINEGFGSTIGKIGLIIIAGLIIGIFLEKTGAAFALANAILKLIGPKRLHTAMASIGYIISIPVFADSGFIILSPLNKALSRKAGVPLAGTVVALAAGLTATHCMVPPTPGPIAAAAIIDADLGKVILIGALTAMVAVSFAVIFAKYAGHKVRLDYDANEDTQRAIPEKELPGITKSLVPILLPIVLIVLNSIASFPTRPFGDTLLTDAIAILGNPVIALILGMFCAFTLPRKFDSSMISPKGWVGEALTAAAIIILITGAGGAFGKVIQVSGIKEVIESGLRGYELGLFLPFLLAATLKTAQGSSTVAIITSASIVMPMLNTLGLDDAIGKAMTVVAIGAGSAVVSHANDSFFWVVTQLSNMDVKQGYKLQSTVTGIIGISSFLFLLILQNLIR